jgi:flagellar motor switch protein FliG
MNGKRKAATLLLSLDPPTAVELLRGLSPQDVEDIAMELATLDSTIGRETAEQEKVALEFINVLQKSQSRNLSVRSFLSEVLTSIVGKSKAEEIQSRIRKTTEKRDPFACIRAAPVDELVLALENEHPQTVAVVLAELPPQKSQEVLALLGEETRLKAVPRMAVLEHTGQEVKQHIAVVVSDKLKTLGGEVLPEKREQTLRKLALMLSGLEKKLRDRLLEEITKLNEETCQTIRNLMMTWEDIPTVADRSLQEALRAVDTRKLAVALYGADQTIVQKIRANISERVAAMLDEEASLMQEPLPKEILDAREEVVGPLREANEQGTLRFVGR